MLLALFLLRRRNDFVEEVANVFLVAVRSRRIVLLRHSNLTHSAEKRSLYLRATFRFLVSWVGASLVGWRGYDEKLLAELIPPRQRTPKYFLTLITRNHWPTPD